MSGGTRATERPKNCDETRRVLFVDQFAEMGGGQRILLDVVRHFTAQGIVCAVALPAKGPLSELLEQEAINVYHFDLPAMSAGRKSLRDLFGYFSATAMAKRQIKQIALKSYADMIFCNGPRCVLPVVLAASSINLAVIVAVHLIFKGKEKAILSWCFRHRVVRAVTFCSPVAADSFPGLAREKRALVGNWVSPHFQCSPKSLDAKHTFNLLESDIAVGVVGRLSVHKGQRLFLEAMKPLANAMPNLKLVLAGSCDFEDPTEDERLRRMASELGLFRQSMFLGAVTNTVALMDALDILVVPSTWEEPFGLVAAEGMARGLPVVATRSGGLVDIVVDGETGFLVEKEPGAIGEAVSHLLRDQALRLEMGSRGRERALGAFSARPRLETILELAKEAMRTDLEGQ